jgi:hypothetical protein
MAMAFACQPLIAGRQKENQFVAIRGQPSAFFFSLGKGETPCIMFSLPYPAADKTLPKIPWSWLSIWGWTAHSASSSSGKTWWLPPGNCWDQFFDRIVYDTALVRK